MIRSIGWIVAIALAAGCSSPPGSSPRDDMGGDGGVGALTIAPTTASLGFGQTQTFTANKPVTWNVVETGGGQIDGGGTYTAPSTPGTFHVHAATSDAPVQEATATVTVADRALALVAGSFGGNGTADGTAAAARFWIVRGMAYDGARYVYLTDATVVRRLDLQTNEVTTIAGAGLYDAGDADGVGAAARFSFPWGLALDGAGGLYVADENAHTIRKIDLATRTVTTVAGAAGAAGFMNAMGTAARFRNPTGLAFDAAGQRLFISDANNGCVRQYDVKTTMVTTVSSTLTQPDGLAWDGSGTLYVADAGPRQVFTIDVDAKATNVLAGAGRGFRDGPLATAHFDSIGPVALVGGAVYVGDTMGVRKIDLAGHTVTTLPVRGGTARTMSSLVGDAQGKLLVALESDSAIVRLDPTAGTTSAVAGPDAVGIGNLDGTGAAARFFDPTDLLAADGTIYVSDANNSEVRALDLGSASVTTLVGTAYRLGDADGNATVARTNYPLSISSDHAGSFYIVEPDANVVRKWDGTTLTTIAGRYGFPGVDDGIGAAARFEEPTASCVDGGVLYVVEQLDATVRKITLATGAVETLAGLGEEPGRMDGVGTAARFSTPMGIACDGAGHVYVADQGNFAIRRIDVASGTVDTVAGALGASGYVDMPGTAARFDSPGEMAYANGFLYVVDNGYSSLHVRKIQVGAPWSVSTIATSTLPQQQFYGVAVDGGGNVYVSNRRFDQAIIYKVASDGTLAPFAGSAGSAMIVDGVGAAANFNDPTGMTFDGTALWVAEDHGWVARRIDVATATVTTPFGQGGNSPQVEGTGRNAFLDRPGGLALAAGALFVADETALARVTLPAAQLSIAAGAIGYGGGMDGVGTAARLNAAGMVSDGAGTIYFTGTNSVRRYDLMTGMVDTIAGVEGTPGSADGVKDAARFNSPKGIALDGAGNAYVTDYVNDTVRKVVIATGEVTTLAGAAGMFGGADGIGDAARFDEPMGIVYDGQGDLYVADSMNGAVRRIEIATRAVSTFVGVLGEKGLQPGALPAHLNTPRGLALLPDGGLVITDEQAVLVVH